MRLKSRNKYGAVKVKADGITFDSKAEYKRYCELKLLEKANQIYSLAVHVRFPLHVAALKIGDYEVDFFYIMGSDRTKGKCVHEDVKGHMTPLSKWKIKHFEAQYGQKVSILRDSGAR